MTSSRPVIVKTLVMVGRGHDAQASARFARPFQGLDHDAQSGAVEELDAGQVDDQFRAALLDQIVESHLEVGGRVDVEFSGDSHDCGGPAG